MSSSKRTEQGGSGSTEDLDLLLDEILPILKKCTPFLLLLVILVWGYSLRAYHLNYPVVGYHNVKEAHTLGEALNFYRGEPLLVPRMRYYAPDDPTRGVHGDNLPLLAWMIVLGWKVFGIELWVARLMVVLFSLGTIALTYIVVKQLFKREDLSLFAALLAAVCPVLVFFGRNVQYDVPATFFLMGAVAAYLRWRKEPKPVWFGLMALSIALGAVSKWPIAIVMFPIALTFPYSRVFPLASFKAYLKQYALALPPAVLTLWWWFFSKSVNPTKVLVDIGTMSFSHIGQFFTGEWWRIVYAYAYIDNFSKIGVWLALFGVVLSFSFIKKFRYRFLALWAASFLPFGLLFANFLSHHNYYQIPYAPLWAILVAVFLNFVVSLIPRIKLGSLPSKSVRWAVLLAVFFFVLKAPLTESADRQFATQFYGLDVAGEYIREHSAPGEMILDSAHQDRGLLWHADRELTASSNLTRIIQAENERDLNWVFVYQWGVGRILGVPEIAEHVYSNYTLKQFAYCFGCLGGGPQQVNDVYYLYQRGGSSPTREEFLANFNHYIQEHPPQTRVYDDPFGRQIELYYITFE